MVAISENITGWRICSFWPFICPAMTEAYAVDLFCFLMQGTSARSHFGQTGKPWLAKMIPKSSTGWTRPFAKWPPAQAAKRSPPRSKTACPTLFVVSIECGFRRDFHYRTTPDSSGLHCSVNQNRG